MKVADFFCGAGGFSEGFRQAGFEVVFALDNWSVAYKTHKLNHPNAKTYKKDITEIANMSDEEFDKYVPDTEVIIGSPPCVAFSNSNKSGKADKTLGLDLLEAYLKIVFRKKHKKGSKLKYWILENVPNVQHYIKDIYYSSDFNLSGDLSLVTNSSGGIYNSKYFGVASNRKRFLCGEFPEPTMTNNEKNVVTLGEILNGLGSPDDLEIKTVIDPNYKSNHNKFEITDMNYIYEIPEFEWKKAKRQKQDKGYMGRMSFPENLDKPARTVMATISTSSRESLIFEYKENSYRLPTVREVATIMSFPLNYLFYGDNLSNKYRLVGNAVPPKMAYAFAKAIIMDERKSDLIVMNPIYKEKKDLPSDFVDLNNNIFELKEEKYKPLTSKFKYHLPYFIEKSFRVELTNYYSDFRNLKFRWDVEIHKSQGKNARVYNLSFDEVDFTDIQLSKINKIIKAMGDKVPSYDILQQNYTLPLKIRMEKGVLGPEEILNLVLESLIEAELSDNLVPCKYENQEIMIPEKIVIGYMILKKIISRGAQ